MVKYTIIRAYGPKLDPGFLKWCPVVFHSLTIRIFPFSSQPCAIQEEEDIALWKMGKQPVKLKAVVYALSPFQQKVMPGLWKDLPGKIHHKVSENWISASLLLGPLIGVHLYVKHYQETEKLSHRY
ncbi:unnamed protein product [Cuscuta europaea]|uniref:Cytochrome b-c1 complex subunit 8 n=1 Tax=Cuscuta europaea TaxID=41803 RepID=A0A9P0YNP2_CUSEU|nr:unnamed protein product [Cuscuta europaea]